MSNIFDYTRFFSNSTIRGYRPYEAQNDVNQSLIEEQYHEDHRLNMFFNEQHREDGDAGLEEAFNREVLNTFLTDVCDRIGVDPAEAIAQEFTLYLPMVEWLRSRYHQQVVQKFEEKLQEHYQELCETVYNHITEFGQFSATNLTRRVIGQRLQGYFRAIIDHTVWWGIDIGWVLTLTAGNVAEICEENENMLFDDITATIFDHDALVDDAITRAVYSAYPDDDEDPQTQA